LRCDLKLVNLSAVRIQTVFGGDVTLGKFEVSMSKVIGNEMQNFSRIVSYLREKWIDFHQFNTKIIFGPFYTKVQIHFTCGNV